MRVQSTVLLLAGVACAIGLAYQGDEGARVAVIPRMAAPHAVPPRATIRVDSRLVLIPVTVTDPLGAPLAGLRRDAFRLFEDGIEQQVTYFASEDAPVSLGIVFDASRSMEPKMEESRAAVARFFHTVMPGDEFLLLSFNDAPRMLSDFTSDTGHLEKMLAGIIPRSWTALLDAVYMGVHAMKRAKNARKALLILSDGADNNSRYTEEETKSLVREGDVCIYSIALVGSGLTKRHARLLRQLSEETGGRLCEVGSMAELPEAVRKISDAMRHQYLLGYSPGNRNSDGLYHKVQVKLNQPSDYPPLRASWRTGYYAPDVP